MEGKNCIEVYPKGTQRTEEVQPMVTASSVEILQSQDGMVPFKHYNQKIQF